MKYYLSIISFLVILIIGCKTTDIVELEKTQEKRNALVSGIYSQEIEPNLVELGSLINELKDLNNEYFDAQDVSKSKTELQEKWLEVAVSTGKCKLFNVTPISRLFYFNNLHTTPLNEEFVENIEIFKDTSDLNIKIFSTKKKGLAALEYLYFEQDSLLNFQVLTTAYVDDLLVNQKAILSYWQDELKTDFITGETISINDGYGELINSFISSIEVSRKERFQQPFGLNSDQLYDFEAQRSGHSKLLYENTFSYLGELITNYFSPFLISEGESELATGFVEAYDSYKTSFEELGEDSFEDIRGVISVTKLEAVEDEIANLLLFIKVELASSYDVLITFSDADGD